MFYKTKYEHIIIKIVITLIIAVLQSLAFSDCIDESNISDDYACIEIWNPVCGCDGITYSNDCYAENAGVTEWIEGECQQLDSSIEGRWISEYFGNTMYEFDGQNRLTYYCDSYNTVCDSTYWGSLDTSDAIPGRNPYTFINDTLTIDLHFGNISEEVVTFLCDGNVIDFNSQQSNLHRIGTDFDDCEDYNGQQLELSSAINSPERFRLNQNYPNPFNPTTSLTYDLPKDELVNITIYDMRGRVVNTLVNGMQTTGYKSIQWNATNGRNEPVSAGLYIYTIQAGEFRQTKKMVLLK